MSDDHEWLEWRRGGVGGSDIGILLGLSNYGSPYSLWCDKVGLLPHSERTERQQIGLDLENAVAKMFTRHTGLHVGGEQDWRQHPTQPWRRCTVDGLVFEGPGGLLPGDALGPVQIKTDGRFGWPDGPPAQYVAQVRWEMGVTGHAHGWLAVLFAGLRFEVFEIEQDELDLAFMVERADAFWHGHVLTGVPPAVDGSEATSRALNILYPEEEPGKTADVDAKLFARWESLRNDRLAVERAVKQAKAEEDAAKNAIVAAVGDAEIVTVDGTQVATLRTTPEKDIAYTRAAYRTLRMRKDTP